MVWKETKMTPEQISEHHKALTQLAERIAEVNEAAMRNPWSKDIAFLERELAKRWNKLVSELTAANVQHEYKLRTVIEEQPQKLPWTLDLFMQRAIDRTDTMAEKDKRTSLFGDGLSSMVGY
jgi:hypothetical protein